MQAHRKRLIERSSYFRGLLCGSFSESCLDCISIQWNLETFINVMKSIYSFPLDITSQNFIHLLEGALYFGVESLVLKCRTWFSLISSSKGPAVLLDDLINIWNFGLEHAIDFVPELCASYLARNFMWAMSSTFFGDIPYSLLILCIKHPHLTVDSEMRLADAIFVWLENNTEQSESLSKNKELSVDLLKQIRISLLPLWFVAGKKNSDYFSELADVSIDSTFKVMKIRTKGSIDPLEDYDSNHLRIRLTEFSEKVDVSGCPQLSSEFLILSLLPSSYSTDSTLRKSIGKSFLNIGRADRDQCQILPGLPPILSFEAVQEVDMSKCPRLHLEPAIEYISLSFPSLRTLKAAYISNFKTSTLLKLMHKCPQINEVDLTVDASPVIPTQVSVLSSSSLAIVPTISNRSSIFRLETTPSTITKLTLQGRSNICDMDLQYISEISVSLQYINLNGCISLTDLSISNLLRRCVKLNSILVCDTSFGVDSILALCSANFSFGSSAACLGKQHLDSLACNLQTLHMGGCRGVDESSLLKLLSQAKQLQSLCLRETHVVDDVLYSFSGSSLVTLDISNTMICVAALAHIVQRNPDLKYLNARGCRRLSQLETSHTGLDSSFSSSSSRSCNQLHIALGNACRLEEVAFGWGFSGFSLVILEPALMSLRSITVGLGGSLGEDVLRCLPMVCPMLESVNLYFQVISDAAIVNIIESLKHLQVLALCYCFGDISILSFKFVTKNLRKLKLERVTPWMTNNDLGILTQNFSNLIELSLTGCKLLNSDCQQLISHGWPGLISLSLEDCGEVTANGISFLFDCVAIEDLVLRHNGPGLQKSFVLDAASKMPMLRRISLDMCDASEGDFDIPDYMDRFFLNTVKIARCRPQRGSVDVGLLKTSRRLLVHKETLVLVWNSENFVRTVIKERL
ncbi:BTB/POZ domain-containing protein FBL11 [Tripterygium wilfordii]|uniref:BTB/POZ domain-containing protein FBL11 n=3 Tax=Tripterygium wilfordii TaxID=458696 RepID=A0A7J7DW21_TRIWF|nr:BTB/POZ domain-containing protein FBL11 isoform X2 [Tripterygium wilfordii]KAF5750489.1 BTB/POZ domain-containing protein FBL11 [Tripterygium wilfordii]